MREITVREAIRDAMAEEMRRDESVFLMGEEVAEYEGAYKVSQGLLQEFGPERVVDTPITEAGFAGVGVGAAMMGLRPIVEFMTWNFAMQAVDQIVNSAAKTRYMSGGRLGLPVVFRGPNGAASQVAAQHSQDYGAWYAHVPGLKVVAPSTPHDAKGLLKAAIRDPDPVIYFEHKRAYRLIRGDVPDEDYAVPIGKAALRREGGDLTVIAWSMMVHESLEAAAELAAEGIEATVLDLRTLAPLDRDAILDAARVTGKVLIVHEDNISGGLGGEIAALIAEHAFDYLDAPVRRLATPDIPAMPFSKPLEDYWLPSKERIAAAMRELAAY